MIQNGFVYIVDNYIIGRLLEVHDYIVFFYTNIYIDRIINNISGVVIEIILNQVK